jgi:hypothetical protein
VLRRIFVLKRDEILGGWRKFHNKELHNLYSSSIGMKPSRMRESGHITRIKEKRNSYRNLMGRPEGKRPLGRPKRKGRIILK